MRFYFGDDSKAQDVIRDLVETEEFVLDLDNIERPYTLEEVTKEIKLLRESIEKLKSVIGN